MTQPISFPSAEELLQGAKVDEDAIEPVLVFLDDLRDSGVVNMFGAAPYIREAFSVDRRTATKLLTYWMETFAERHGE